MNANERGWNRQRALPTGYLRSFAFICGPLLLLSCGRLYAQSPLGTPPSGDDYTQATLAAYQAQLLARYGSYRDVPLDVKAEYFGWLLERYHFTSFQQMSSRVRLPEQIGQRPEPYPDRDASTWNGALLAALNLEYAVKRDADTLRRIITVVRGLHFFFEVTGQPGLPARCVNCADGKIPIEKQPQPYVAADGTVYLYESDPAKGGFNQLAAGYAALMLYAYRDLPPDMQQLARADMTALVLHVIDHDYRATERDGRRTTYGDITPLVGSQGMPFNAQVAYLIVALGQSFPPDDPAQRERIREQFERLRGKHHVYYEDPWMLVQPQRVGISPLVKGMNDRNHVTSAAFWGLTLELDAAAKRGEEWNAKFLHQLGQTIVWTLRNPETQRNAVCQFMGAAMLQDAARFNCMATVQPAELTAIIERGLADGIEQLRRFKLDRFQYPGTESSTRELQWNDAFRPDDNYWKVDPHLVWMPTGPATREAYCAMDFQYAYWLFRLWRLDLHPAVVKLNLPVLRPTGS